jgi:hypothetical protein
MPKKVSRDKHKRRRVTTATGAVSRRAYSVKELLSSRAQALTEVTAQAERTIFWKEWLCRHLPADLAAQISGVIEREGALVIFAASSAWCARLRFVVEELGGELREAAPAVTTVRVRVRPKSPAPRA